MEDRDIVTLYWQRDQEAIRQTDRQYGRYLSAIAFGILADREDSRETVNDTYLRAWDSMPPHRPQVLATYLGRITRQLSIDRWRARGRAKRGGSQYALSLEELGDCVSGAATVACYLLYYLLHVVFAWWVHKGMVYDILQQFLWLGVVSVVSLVTVALTDLFWIRMGLLAALLGVCALWALRHRDQVARTLAVFRRKSA